MSLGSYQRAASSNNSSTSNGGDAPPPQSAAATATSGSVRLAGDNTKDRMYEPKHHQKAVRVLTVVAYVFFVSLAAITLSLYYLFIYNPPPPPPAPPPSISGNNNAFASPIVINITDCKRVIAVAVVNRTLPTPILETPRVLSVIDEPPPPAATPPARASNNTSYSSSDIDFDRFNSTKYAYGGGDYSKTGDNDPDYYA